MNNYVCWIAAVLISGVLLFLSSDRSYRQRKTKNADWKVEEKYDAMARRLQKFKSDDEYKKLKQKVEKEVRYGSAEEQRDQLQKRLYSVKVKKEQEESGVWMATGVTISAMVSFVLSAQFVPFAYWQFVTMSGWAVLLIYIFCLIYKIPKRTGYCRLICVIESILTELDGAWRERQGEQEKEKGDIDTLINKLKQCGQEQAS